jgi:hypothetical protein
VQRAQPKFKLAAKVAAKNEVAELTFLGTRGEIELRSRQHQRHKFALDGPGGRGRAHASGAAESKAGSYLAGRPVRYGLARRNFGFRGAAALNDFSERQVMRRHGRSGWGTYHD